MATHGIFFIYEGKSPVAQAEQTKGLSYELVMVDEKMLGTGYKLYVDNFYTSPTLFRDLLQKGLWVCGTICSNRVGFPQATDNRLPRNAPRGIRNDKLEWKDTREVLMCSSFHSAVETARYRGGWGREVGNGRSWLFLYLLQWLTTTSELNLFSDVE